MRKGAASLPDLLKNPLLCLGTAGNNGLMPASPQRITFAEMRAADIFGVLVYCTDYRCITPLVLRPTAGRMMCGCQT